MEFAKTKRYEVIVATTMTASVYVNATCCGEAEDIVRDAVSATDYCNETCGFDFDDERIDEITNTATDYMEIADVYEEG